MKLLVFALAVVATSAVTQCPQSEVSLPSGICVEPKFIEGCFKYASSKTCGKCYKLSQAGFCEYQKQSGEACCLQKKADGCAKCNTGLKLDKNKTCVENRIMGCLQKNKDGDCINCSSEYFLEGGICKMGISQCIQYDRSKSPLACIKCKSHHSLLNNVCLKNRILGCDFETGLKCKKCYDPFKIKGDHCEISNCTIYNQFGCTGCECGYFLNNKNTCDQIQSGCIRYQRGVCIDCQPGFKLRGGVCTMEGCKDLDFLDCKKCNEGYNLVNGRCKMENCEIWDNGNCFLCNANYVVQEGKCIQENRSSSLLSANSS